MKGAIVISLFVLALVQSSVDASSVSVSSSYKEGTARFEVVGRNKEALPGLQVIVSKEDEPSVNAVFRNGAYEVDTQLPVGIADFNVRVGVNSPLLEDRCVLRKETPFLMIK